MFGETHTDLLGKYNTSPPPPLPARQRMSYCYDTVSCFFTVKYKLTSSAIVDTKNTNGLLKNIIES